MTPKEQLQNVTSWEEQLRSQLAHHEAEPPAHLWESIESDLAAREGASSKDGIQIKQLYGRWIGKVAAVVLAVGIGLWEYTSLNTEELAFTHTHRQMKTSPHDDTPVETIAKNKQKNGEKEKIDKTKRIETPSLFLRTHESTATTDEEYSFLDEVTIPLALEERSADSSTVAPVAQSYDEHYYVFVNDTLSSESTSHPSPIHPFRFAFHVRSGDIISSFSGNKDSYIVNEGYWSNINSGAEKGDPIEEDDVRKSGNLYQSHDIPFKTAAMISWGFFHHFTLDAGISYTYLHSSLHFMENGISDNMQQRVHLLGIPVALKYDIFHSHRWSGYISAGGEVAKAIGIEWWSDSNNYHPPSAFPWQCSLNAAFGIQYDLFSCIGIYLQPSVGYYLQNHSTVKTYYSENPFTPSLQLGMRFYIRK